MTPDANPLTDVDLASRHWDTPLLHNPRGADDPREPTIRAQINKGGPYATKLRDAMNPTNGDTQ